MPKVLLAGETWVSYQVNLKGFASYTTGAFNDAAPPFVDALRGSSHHVEHIPNHLAERDFPSTLEDLDAFDVVVLSDIPSDTLLLHRDTFERGQRTVDRLALLDDWVQRGKGLLMVGGYMSFSGFEGKAKYQNTALADVLPVQMLGYDDRIECPSGLVPRQVRDHEILDGIDGPWPYFLGYNRLLVRARGEVVLEIQDDPMLIVGRHGRGRTAAFASDCTPHWGSPEFTSWRHYAQFWSQLISWLAGATASAPATNERSAVTEPA